MHAMLTKRIAQRLLSKQHARTLASSSQKIHGSHHVHHQSQSKNEHGEEQAVFRPEKVVILRKVTRYEFERHMHREPSDDLLSKQLALKGSDFNGLLTRHNEHYDRLQQVIRSFEQQGIETQVVTRNDYSDELIEWADAVVAAGGDGTFLLAASKVNDRKKPLIGINTDPLRSEGYLCLPKRFSNDFDSALDKLLKQKFKWTWRKRLRITMEGKHENDTPKILHKQQQLHPEFRFSEHVQEYETLTTNSNGVKENPPRILPVLALNEVFIGETLSARVSYYEVSVDGSHSEKQKSSGITISTGTGSSSWSFHINHVSKTNVKQILDIANKLSGSEFPLENEGLIRKITHGFNNSLRFDPEDLCMAFTVRDPVVNGIFQVSNPRGFCHRMTIRSRMWDACLVVDGDATFRFNDGAIATMEMFDEDSLRTVTLKE